MLLAIDIGNTTIRFAVFEGAQILGRWQAPTSVHRSADEWMIWLTQSLELQHLSPSKISDIIIASVVPSALPEIRLLAKRYFSCDPMIVGDHNVQLNITIAVETPEEVGADLLAGAVAALDCVAPPLLVLDMGSATTLSYIDDKRQFRGVAIAPGLSMSMRALHSGTAQLPQITLEPTPHAIGASTIAAMQGGVYWGYIGLIEGLITQAKKDALSLNSAQSLPVVATGGDGPLLCRATKHIDIFDPDLVLKGLRLIYDYNRNMVDSAFKAQDIA